MRSAPPPDTSTKLPFLARKETSPRRPLTSTFNGEPGQLASTESSADSASTLGA